jgi:hypothetical protein
MRSTTARPQGRRAALDGRRAPPPRERCVPFGGAAANTPLSLLVFAVPPLRLRTVKSLRHSHVTPAVRGVSE